MFAIIETGSKQYKVSNGDTIYIEKVAGNKGDSINFDKVLMVDNKIGKPYLEGAKVVGEIDQQTKGEKLMIIHHFPQKHHSKTTGHRQQYTKVIIKEIVG